MYLILNISQDVVSRIITAHLQRPLPSPMRLDGEGYVLTASECAYSDSLPMGLNVASTEHTAWTFGREKVKFFWGEEAIVPCRDKWTFCFASLTPE